jgi:hypothetical protein
MACRLDGSNSTVVLTYRRRPICLILNEYRILSYKRLLARNGPISSANLAPLRVLSCEALVAQRRPAMSYCMRARVPFISISTAVQAAIREIFEDALPRWTRLLNL